MKKNKIVLLVFMGFFSNVYASDFSSQIVSALKDLTIFIPVVAITFPINKWDEGMRTYLRLKNRNSEEAIELKNHSEQLFYKGVSSIVFHNLARLVKKEPSFADILLLTSACLAIKGCSDCYENRNLCYIALSKNLSDEEQMLAACEDNEDDVRGYKESRIHELDRKHHGNYY